MPLFDFECPKCDHLEVDTYQPIASTTPTIPCPNPECTADMLKILTFPAFRAPLPAHFNAATNSYVTSEADLREKMKLQSVAMTERTGVEHNFTPISRHETAELGVTDEGLDATRRAERKQGRTTSQLYL